MPSAERRYRAGESIEDYCRACKTDRMHTIIVTDSDAQPLRVSCGYCHSEHNYRGGPRLRSAEDERASARQAHTRSAEDERASARQAHTRSAEDERASAPQAHTRSAEDERAAARQTHAPSATTSRQPFPIVSEREVSMTGDADLEMLLRRVIREETGISPVAPADRWRGGSLVLRPGTPGLQEKSWPIETFFHKVVMLRNRLRTLEQHVNAADLPDDAKVKLQSYITGCYGSLTSFNVLFADEDDQFKGSGSD
jgi:hypothetical protein